MGWLFRDRPIDAVLVGADRIAANGDVANVAGTYPAGGHRRASWGAGLRLCTPPPSSTSRRRQAPTCPSSCAVATSSSRWPGEPAGGGDRRPCSAERRHAGRSHHGVRHRRWDPLAAVRRSPSVGRDGGPIVDRGAGDIVGRGGGASLMATTASRTERPGRAYPGPPDERPRSSCVPSSSTTGSSPPTPSATSTIASSTGRAGAAPSTASACSALAMEYVGYAPQPLFVMGEPDGRDGRAARRHPTARRLRGLARRPAARHRAGLSPRRPGRRWSACGSTAATFRPAPGAVFRILPSEIGDLNRLYNLGFTAWLPSEAVSSGVYYGVRIGGRLVAAAGHARRSAPTRGSPWSAT